MATKSDPFERNERGALEILEGGFHLLRSAPPRCLLCYFAGSIPFVLGLLYFLTDMSYGAVAASRLIRSSLVVAALFVWMKCWQAAFAGELYDYLSDEPSAGWNAKRVLRLLCVQSAVMPWQFAVFPVAFLVLLPYAWCCAFFHNLSVTGDGRETLGGSLRAAWKQSQFWPWQNHKILLIMVPFALFVFLNLGALLYLLPMLLKTYLGVETIFSKSEYMFFNSTSLLAATGASYLCVNPLVKAAYVQRCFLGASMTTGRDLVLELKRLRARRALKSVLSVVALTLCLSAMPGFAATDTGSSSAVQPSLQRTISPRELDRAIRETMDSLEYSWRMPAPKEEKPQLSGFWRQVFDFISDVWHKIEDAVSSFFKWLGELFDGLSSRKKDPERERRGIGEVPLWLTVLILCATALGGVLLLLARRRRQAAGVAPSASAELAVRVDLADESLVADDLPVARWLALARECIARGDLRTGLRAFTFAGLAHLSEKKLLTIASFKSNREYQWELGRRAHMFPALVASFSENVAILERVWYGRHDVDQDAFARFTANHERIMSDVEVA